MRWKVDETATIGVCQTNNHVREYSWQIVKSTKGKDTVMDILPNKESAERMFTTILNDVRIDMTSKKNPVPATLILKKVIKHGTLVGLNTNGVRIRWDYEETTSQKMEKVAKYSLSHARRLVKPRF